MRYYIVEISKNITLGSKLCVNSKDTVETLYFMSSAEFPIDTLSALHRWGQYLRN